MIDNNVFDSIKIGLASPEMMRKETRKTIINEQGEEEEIVLLEIRAEVNAFITQQLLCRLHSALAGRVIRSAAGHADEQVIAVIAVQRNVD